ncbi:LysE family translocator [Roseibium sp. RKSG952]|uniref:LysE family translocator n=1 Tax=Roseibium sp. RKSG952 TaxID=2529384 RepID=UPI0012BC885F|nr:LysE family transporter [Roseibium sp. RKSG952]MTH95243.1 LysE family translocator [Roseibium sp. RKSG952]
MLEFLAAAFFLLITPGPGALSIAGVGAGFGMHAGFRYFAGLLIGFNLVALSVVLGLEGAVMSVPVLRTSLLMAATAYLLFVAAKIAFSGSRVAIVHPERPPGVVGGLALQAINPKTYAELGAFFVGFAIYPHAPVTETVVKLLIINAVWIPVHLAWLVVGATLHKLDLTPRAHAWINAVMAGLMVIAIAIAITAEFR